MLLRRLHITELACIILILSLGNAYSQNFEWFSGDFPNSRFLGVYEVDDRYYGAVSNGASFGYDSNTIYQLSMYELLFTQDGMSLEQNINIPYEDNYATISLDFIEETGVWLLVQSKVLDLNNKRYRAILCDKYFNILSEQNIDTSGYPITFYIDSKEDFTYVLGSIFGHPNYLFFAKYDHANPLSLPPVHVKKSTPSNIFGVSNMIIDNSGDMLVFYYGGITKLDTNLHQKFDLNYSDINTAYYGTILNIESKYYTHSLTEQEGVNGFNSLVLQEYDSTFQVLLADTIGVPGQDNYPFIAKSLDYRLNELLLGGHLDGPYAHIDLNKSIKKFYLAKYDLDMDRIWYKEFGGDKAYILIGLKILEDHKVVAYGYVTDTLSGLWHGYIMFVDQNGEIVNTKNIPLNHNSDITIINPGSNHMHLLNPKGVKCTLEIYSMQGHHITSANVSNSEHFIPIDNLAAGTYTFVLKKNNLILQSGLWVKEN